MRKAKCGSFEVFIHQGSQDSEQPGLFLWLSLLGAGGWAGDLMRATPT